VQKQASWGTTRDNLVLGSEGNGIDGAHILTPMPYLISAGKVTQNNQPTPMYIMARPQSRCAVHLGRQGICRPQALDRRLALQGGAGEEEGVRQGCEGAMTFPAARMTSGSATGSPPAASIPTRTSRPSSCRRRRWSPT
jgi:nitrate/nitrite transport system substrate-binding protein